MLDIDCEAGETYDVLLQDGEFRLIKDPQHPYENLVQHHCDNPFNTDEMYCDLQRGWHYCWNGEKTCAGCGDPVPPMVVGFQSLLDWER